MTLDAESPIVAADAARAELEATCRRLLAAGWEAWRLRGQVEELALRLAQMEHRPGAVARFVGGESAERAAEKRRKGNGERRP